tara:strand:+ start:72 stop:377 length:306 start_codon:yes stop_codon:yes gene_type:complete
MNIGMLIFVYLLYAFILNNIVWVGVYTLKYSIRGIYNKITKFNFIRKTKQKSKYNVVITDDIENNIKEKNENNIAMKNMDIIPPQKIKRSKSDTELDYIIV